MRMRSVVVALAVAALAAAGAALAKDKTSQDSAVGSGTFGPGCTVPPGTPACFAPAYVWSFTLSAQSDPLGQDARGHFQRTNATSGNSQGGPVTCLNVAGNMASIGGIDLLDPRPHVRGTPYVVYVIDGGASGPDMISPIFHYAAGDPAMPPGWPDACPPPVSPSGYFPLTSGAITVQDAICERVQDKKKPGKDKCKGEVTVT